MKLLEKKPPLIIGALVAAVASLAMLAGVFETWSQAAGDRFFLPKKPDENIVIVAIDDASLAAVGRWPWDRQTHAKLIDALHEAGARVIALDVNFPEPSSSAGDRVLAEAIHRAGNVVLPVELSFISSKTQTTFNPRGTVAPFAQIGNEAEAMGFSNTPLDADGVVRRVPISAHAEDGTTAFGFAYEAAKMADAAPPASEIPLEKNGRLIIHFTDAPGKAFQTLSASDVLSGAFDASAIRGKTVFVGATARDLHDEQNVPTSSGNPMSGVEIHANIYDTLVSRDFLRVVPIWVHIVLFLLVGFGLGWLVPRVRARVSFFVTVGIYLVWVMAAFVLFDRGWVLDIIWIGLLLIFCYASLLLERWVSTDRERRKTRDAFSRYVSASVVESIMQNVESLKLGGERRNMSVLFSDLRGFTSLSEGLKPEELVQILNRYLHEMTNIVFEENGVLDKYIGDAVMAFWNAPFDQPDHAERAVRAAIRMKERLRQMNEAKAFGKDIELRVGIGINTGEMVVGNIGGERRYDYTVIGDSVNTASRTEGLCKLYGVETIVTEHTKDELDESFVFRKLDRVAVKGKKEPMRIYEVLGFASSISDDDKRFAASYEEALDAYFDRYFDKALKLCRELIKQRPNDTATKQLLERVDAFKQSPPPEDWNGVWILTSK